MHHLLFLLEEESVLESKSRRGPRQSRRASMVGFADVSRLAGFDARLAMQRMTPVLTIVSASDLVDCSTRRGKSTCPTRMSS